MGVPVSAKNIFPSNIQGLPTWFEIRANGEGHTGRSPRVDIVVAMNAQTMGDDIASLASDGWFLYDSTWPLPPELHRDDVNYLPVPLTALSVEAFPDPKVRILMKNVTYVGALAALLNIDLVIVKQLLQETYAKKKHLSEANMNAVQLAANAVRANFDCPLPAHLEKRDRPESKILLEGNSACALGALYAGATVAAWYPITPATSLTDAFRRFCERYRKDPETGTYDACVVQAEDEMAAAGVVLGAGWSGARAFTPTSGPGISLMGEFIGFGYQAEIPFVVYDVQRVGPSTGLPTRTQQGDITTCVYASHGDTKHIVLMPSDPEECFYLSIAAFDLADRYQTPVIVLSDLNIGMNEWISRRLEWDDSYRPDRGKLLSAEQLEQMEHFYRYLDSDDDGICYRTRPGDHPTGGYFTRGTGHNPYGAYSEKEDDYVENAERIARKVASAADAVPQPVLLPAGERDPRVLEAGEGYAATDERRAAGNGGGRSTPYGVISVGSCDLGVREGLEWLAEDGIHLDYLRVRAFPFPKSVEQFCDAHEQVWVIEQNRDGQLRSLIILETAVTKAKLRSVRRYGGTPIDAATVADRIADDIYAIKRGDTGNGFYH